MTKEQVGQSAVDRVARGCQILSSLGCADLCCEHDIIIFYPTEREPSDEQLRILVDDCGFFKSEEYGGWAVFP